MAQALPQSSRQKKPSFFSRKMEAYRAFGTALSRPQSNFRNYLIEKRKLNLGFAQRENSNLEAIQRFRLTPDDLQETPKTFQQNPLPITNQIYSVVETDEEFDAMLKKLEKVKELTLDLEENQEHSYYGMTCLLQIGTYEKTYLLDPFPQYENIKKRLKKILESSKILKIVHGGDNDFISMNRDFGISMAGVLDTQFVQQQIYSTCLQIIQDGDIDYLKQDDILWKSATDEKGNLLSTAMLSKLSTERIGLKKLAKIYFPDFTDPADATLADWRIRPLESNPEMIYYAVYDVYILLYIWSKMKPAIKLLDMPEIMLAEAVKKTSKLLLKFSPKPSDGLEKVLRDTKIVPVNGRMFGNLFEFRKIRAKVVDESEEELLKISEFNKLIKANPRNTEQLVAVIQRGRSIPSETIQETSKTLLRLLIEGDIFNQNMRTVKCHVCDGKYEYPHIAWGCIETYSQRAVNNFMSKPENAAYRLKEYERRVRNWQAKRPNVPYPYAPPK